jgi:hypothetical protein
MDCEKINSRRKYLERKQETTDDEKEELGLIYQVYTAQQAVGLSPPRCRKVPGIKSKAMQMLDKLNETDSELRIWLERDLNTYEPDQLYDIYEDLKAKYRPRIGLDPVKCLPIYDDTYRSILDKILTRFDDYEEAYNSGLE